MSENMQDCPCMGRPDMYDTQSRVCQSCPWYLVVGALTGVDFEISRQEFMRRLIQAGHRSNDRYIVAAIARQYKTNETAAALSWRRARRSWKDSLE